MARLGMLLWWRLEAWRKRRCGWPALGSRPLLAERRPALLSGLLCILRWLLAGLTAVLHGSALPRERHWRRNATLRTGHWPKSLAE